MITFISLVYMGDTKENLSCHLKHHLQLKIKENVGRTENQLPWETIRKIIINKGMVIMQI